MNVLQSVCSVIKRTRALIFIVPLSILFLGVASNQAVLIANSDTFPVMVNPTKAGHFSRFNGCTRDDQILEDMGVKLSHFSVWNTRFEKNACAVTNQYGMLDDTHKWMNFNGKKTHLNALADIIDMQTYIMSIGDLGIMLGGWLLGFAPLVWLVLVVEALFKPKES